MDENYLDSLLNEVSLDKEIDHKIEEELDSQIQQEKIKYQEQQSVSDEDLFNMDLELDANDMQSEQDVHFSEEQMDELDHLDSLADLDIGDLDFSDIDFDDLDVTKLDGVESDDLDDLLKEFEGDLDISNLFDSAEGMDEQTDSSYGRNDDSVLDETTFTMDTPNTAELNQDADLNEDSFDADQFLDSLLDDTPAAQPVANEDSLEVANQENLAVQSDIEDSSVEDEDLDLLQALEEFGAFEDVPKEESTQQEPVSQLSDAENDDLEDLLSMLDLGDFSDAGSVETTETSSESTSDTLNTDALDDFADIEELPSKKKDKKQQLMEVLFGEPDEDDILSDEELAELEAKKAAKKAAKQQKKEAAKKKKEEKTKAAQDEKNAKNSQKQKLANEKKILKAQKKQQLRAEALAEAASEKKLNKPMVIFIFTLFLGGTFMFFLATNNFNYSQAIEKATNYFANQKYRKAYDEIVGVEVKEKDEDLKDRIYTVMYVERLYESYLNNLELGRQEKALDSLLRGVDKYYEHYEEAKELGITSDLDFSFNQIQTVLDQQYGITVDEALEINAMSNYDYVQYIQSVVGDTVVMPEVENTTGEDVDSAVQSEDAVLPE